MALMDEFKEERESIKNKSTKEKLSYFWYYYKWWVILPIIIVIIGGNLIHTIATKPKILLDGMYINIDNLDTTHALDTMNTSFVEEQGYDSEKYIIAYNPNHVYLTEEQKSSAPDSFDDPSLNKYAVQSVVAQLGAKSLNFIVGPTESLLALDSNQLFADLTTILTEEQQALYESYYIYLDEANTIPILIDISKCGALQEVYDEYYDSIAIGIINDQNEMDIMLKFVDYLMGE